MRHHAFGQSSWSEIFRSSAGAGDFNSESSGGRRPSARVQSMRPTPVVTIASRIALSLNPGNALEGQNVALRDPRAMFCKFEGEVEESRVVVGQGSKGMSEQGPARV